MNVTRPWWQRQTRGSTPPWWRHTTRSWNRATFGRPWRNNRTRPWWDTTTRPWWHNTTRPWWHNTTRPWWHNTTRPWWHRQTSTPLWWRQGWNSWNTTTTSRPWWHRQTTGRNWWRHSTHSWHSTTSRPWWDTPNPWRSTTLRNPWWQRTTPNPWRSTTRRNPWWQRTTPNPWLAHTTVPWWARNTTRSDFHHVSMARHWGWNETTRSWHRSSTSWPWWRPSLRPASTTYWPWWRNSSRPVRTTGWPWWTRNSSKSGEPWERNYTGVTTFVQNVTAHGLGWWLRNSTKQPNRWNSSSMGETNASRLCQSMDDDPIVLIANTRWKSFQTPNYPANYPSNCVMKWLVMAPEHHHVFLMSHHIDLEMVNNCVFDNVTFYGGRTMNSPRLIVKCKGSLRLKTKYDMILVVFQSDKSSQHSGFRFIYTTRQSRSKPKPMITSTPTATTTNKQGLNQGHKHDNNDHSHTASDWHRPTAIIGGVMGALCMVVLALPFAWYFCHKKKIKPTPHYNVSFSQSRGTGGGSSQRIGDIQITARPLQSQQGSATARMANNASRLVANNASINPSLMMPFMNPTALSANQNVLYIPASSEQAQVGGMMQGGVFISPPSYEEIQGGACGGSDNLANENRENKENKIPIENKMAEEKKKMAAEEGRSEEGLRAVADGHVLSEERVHESEEGILEGATALSQDLASLPTIEAQAGSTIVISQEAAEGVSIVISTGSGAEAGSLEIRG